MNATNFFPTIAELIKSFSGELIILVVLFLLRTIGVDLYIKSKKTINFFLFSFRTIVFRKKCILLYTDANDNGSSTSGLCQKLTNSLQDKNIKVIPLESSEDLLMQPLSPFFIRSIIIILTDVSPLSSDKAKRNKIQKELAKYADKGGILILGHDVLYRRSRNNILEKLCGVTLTNFFKCESLTKYKKNTKLIERITKNQKLLDELPDKLSLNDGECVTGDWADHVKFLYISDDEKQIPLVTYQEVGNGVINWINSGDHTESGPPSSIAEPAEGIIILLDRLIRYSKN